MRGTLVLVANASRAKLLHVVGDTIHQLDAWEHPEARLKESELGTDRPGRLWDSGSPNRSAADWATPMQETEHTRFARELAGELRTRVLANDGVDVVLCAPPKFLGALRNALDSHIGKRVTETVSHDYTATPDGQLLSAMRALGVKGTRAPV